MDLPYYREYDLPWTNHSGQERKFKRLLAMIMGVTFVLGALWPFLPTPERDPYEVQEIPPRIAELLLEQKPLPPPPPELKEPEPEPEPEPGRHLRKRSPNPSRRRNRRSICRPWPSSKRVPR